MATTAPPSFGIMTPPMNVGYHDIVRVWREADDIPSIQHAWLFDHLMPIGGDPDGPIFEGWTLLAALAPQTRRLRLGLMVTSNRFRLPAVLAKIATTVDVVSGGRLDFGIGAGSRPSIPIARREYVAYGLPYHDSAHAVGSLNEACTIIRRLWTEDAPFDFDGVYHHLEGAYGNPKPVQRPGPPIVIGGRSTATLRVAAEHADVWNIPGGDIADATARSAMLDRFCTDIGRDPAAITRSMFLPASSDRPETTRAASSPGVRPAPAGAPRRAVPATLAAAWSGLTTDAGQPYLRMVGRLRESVDQQLSPGAAPRRTGSRRWSRTCAAWDGRN
jgi:alkanesulfonate monooxygenase SsuD/methylene tetrahydromethanopterin reductase-like flavin-dependent oxidoreductase (luciferase family)